MKSCRILILCIAAALLCACAAQSRETVATLTATGAAADGPRYPYGVFLGRNGDETDGLEAYQTVVIEPEAFSGAQIAALHDAGCTVYGYLNVGAVEEYRDYYGRFADLSLGVYEDWPDERWVDVSDPAWQAFLTQELAPAYLALGLDGFFLDNADVYYHFQTDEIYDGLCAILRGLRAACPGRTLLINGGDVFVTRCVGEGCASALFDGVDQETVFTAIDFDTETFHAQEAEETAYFKAYLQTVRAAGLRGYLLEYGADDALAAQIDAYCAEYGFVWYNAASLALD